MKVIDIGPPKSDKSEIRVSNTESLSVLDHQDQIKVVNRLFMGEKDPNCLHLFRDLEKKRYSYYRQDLSKKRVENLTEILTINELIEKLVISKLKCVYCHKPVQLFYSKVREPMQWSLDRIDNSIHHTCDNTCIACLQCNLKRRTTSAKAFAFTKNLSIRKID